MDNEKDLPKGLAIVHNKLRIVCYGVNMAMSEWGEEIFSIFAKNYVLKRMDKI